MTISQEKIDRIRFMYDTTSCSMGRIARNVGVSSPTVTKYVDDRSIMPSPPVDESARWSGPNNSATNRGD